MIAVQLSYANSSVESYGVNVRLENSGWKPLTAFPLSEPPSHLQERVLQAPMAISFCSL